MSKSTLQIQDKIGKSIYTLIQGYEKEMPNHGFGKIETGTITAIDTTNKTYTVSHNGASFDGLKFALEGIQTLAINDVVVILQLSSNYSNRYILFKA